MYSTNTIDWHGAENPNTWAGIGNGMNPSVADSAIPNSPSRTIRKHNNDSLTMSPSPVAFKASCKNLTHKLNPLSSN